MKTRDDTKADQDGKFSLPGGSQVYLELREGAPKWPLQLIPDGRDGEAVILFDEQPVRLDTFNTLEVRGASPESIWLTVVGGENEHIGYHARKRPTLLFEAAFQGQVENGVYQLPSKVVNDESKAQMIDVRGYRFVKLSCQLTESPTGANVVPCLTGYDLDTAPSTAPHVKGKRHQLLAPMPDGNQGSYASISLGEAQPMVEGDLLCVPNRYNFVTADCSFTAPVGTAMDLGSGIRFQLWGYP